MEGNEEERRAIVYEYYRIYRQLQKKHSLRERSSFDIFGNNSIEIWEYEGEERRRCVCKVKEETGTECYKKAMEQLKGYSIVFYGEETAGNGKRTG